MTKWFDVCGTPTLERIEAVMHACGYRRTEGRPGASGEYRVDHGDAAPGWSDWMWEVEVHELPDHPIADLLARWRALEAADEPA